MVTTHRKNNKTVKNLTKKSQSIWKSLNWKKIQLEVYKIQNNIFDLSKKKELKKVHQLQAQLIELESAKYLAVRRVSQDNRGKKSAGVDGLRKLEPSERYKLAKKLKLDKTSQAIKRVRIPKSGTIMKRPLGIPTIEDRAKQSLVKLALEPQWEALFESNSYGFRPGRKCADATWRIRHKMKYGSYWVFDGDIAKCFDQIDHKAILNKLNTIPVIEDQVKAWLKAGIFENGFELPNPRKGTPTRRCYISVSV